MSSYTSGFDPGSILFPDDILSGAMADAINALPMADKSRISHRTRVDAAFKVRARKLVSDFAVMMMLAKTVDEERKFKAFLEKVRSHPENDEDCITLAKAMIGYTRLEPEPQKGIPAYVKRDIFLKRIDVVERNLCG